MKDERKEWHTIQETLEHRRNATLRQDCTGGQGVNCVCLRSFFTDRPALVSRLGVMHNDHA